MTRVLIIGATSAIAESTARLYAASGAALFLVGRDALRLEAIADDLKVRGAAAAGSYVLDVNDFDRHEDMLAAAWAALGDVDLVLIAHGSLPAQDACAQSVRVALEQFSTNALSTIALATVLVQRLKRDATLAVISSVAGDRGRASNYAYGSAKAAVTAFMSGLRQRLHREGINVLTLKPGFVDTPMTQAFEKGALWVGPDTIARVIVRAVQKRRGVAYLPGFWWAIMLAIKAVPEAIFRRVSL